MSGQRPEVMKRVMHQWWCFDCRKWIGTPQENRSDVSDKTIALHLCSHQEAAR